MAYCQPANSLPPNQIGGLAIAGDISGTVTIFERCSSVKEVLLLFLSFSVDFRSQFL